ncbi:MAG: molybdenum transporter, periplasmic molybdate-binding protein [Marmoricola sp.]|jgi:molybdate transport system substrate-binding protein|nr:molybdenum transporter, periplasmic molybdate-binding protein [Marmoricola sp.]
MKLPLRPVAVVIAVILSLPTVAACGGGSSKKKDTLRVFAASSLTGAFTTLGKDFEKKHPGVRVVFNFGPSSGLAEQIVQGAPAGVFASASPTTMDAVVERGDAKQPQTFASNSMEIVVPAANPGKVTSLKDLARPGLKVAVCQIQVPCGVTAAQLFKKAGTTVKPVTEETDVKSVLTKVVLGEVDAGVVYVTDALAAGSKVKGITIPAAQNASTAYPIAVLTHAKHAGQAQEFVDLVLSSDGAEVLRDAGFQKP